MLIRVTFEPEGNEKKVLDALIGMLKKEDEGVFKKPLTAEEASEELGKVAEAVEDKAEASEDKPKKAKATKSTPKAEKPAPEAPSEEKKVDSEMVRAILFDLRQMGKKAEVKELFEEFGVSKLSEIREEQYAAVFEAATKIKNAG
jgi:FtsZ-interacting cell division protein YlmF